MKDNNSVTVLVILDGVGHRDAQEYNAVQYAKMPNFKTWLKQCPHAFLKASGPAVGLPPGYTSNSEVGHLTLGAGRIIKQSAGIINDAIEDKNFFANKAIISALQKIKGNGKKLHIMGLLSDAGVHSRMKHLEAFLDLAHQQGITNIVIHAFLDGRDSAPQSAAQYLTLLNNKLTNLGSGVLGSLHGRFYAMDRDTKWDRIEKTYQVLTQNQPILLHSWRQALDYYYNNHITDEFIPPTKLAPTATIADGDGVIFFNFRPDRARELTACFVDPKNVPFPTKKITPAFFLTPIEYGSNLTTTVAFPGKLIQNTLKEVLDQHGKTIFSIAETEKYAHVTYFFNGRKEKSLPRETRILIPSLGSQSYSEHPEMSAAEITNAVISSLKTKPCDFYLINYANPDMVGHSGSFGATIKALEHVDVQLGILFHQIVTVMNGTLYITSDHGKAEQMFDPETQQPLTSHTNNPVPFIMVQRDEENKSTDLPITQLADVAPFILKNMGIALPDEMKKVI